jgi:hypothetical protein
MFQLKKRLSDDDAILFCQDIVVKSKPLGLDFYKSATWNHGTVFHLPQPPPPSEGDIF